jgi:beta-lactamase regulating signal transducer with metallopeptidase domain
MPVDFFDNAYFLQSIGWAIANNFWQVSLLWLSYKAATFIDRDLSASIKYLLSQALLFLSFAWFIITIIQNYHQLQVASSSTLKNGLLEIRLLNQALPFIAVFYFSLLTFYAVSFLNHYRKHRLVSTSNLLKVPFGIKLFTNRTALHLGIKKKVRVWLSEHVEVPSVTGFIKPVILLPVAMINNLSADQVNAILLHELAHIKRNDYLFNLLQSIITTILYFNPFVILLSKVVKKERENCCDDWVLNYQFNKIEYAKALLVLEEQRHGQMQLALAATNDKKVLLHRIQRLLNIESPSTNISFTQKFKLSGFCLLLLMAGLIQMPWQDNKVFVQKKIPVAITKQLPPAAPEVFENAPKLQEISSETISNKTVPAVVPKKTMAGKPKVAKKQWQPTIDNDYVLVMINEDELPNKNIPTTIATTISNEVKDSLLSAFVKIEEQESGKKQINTYYLKLRAIDGKIDITPLLILKKYKSSPQKNKPQTPPVPKLVNDKKRIST